MTNCPGSRRANFMPRTTIAATLIEEIDSATARKSAVAIRRFGSGRNSGGSMKPSETPRAKRMKTPVAEMASAGRPAVRISFASASMPMSSSNSSTPNSAIASRIAFCAGSSGKTACCACGQESEDRRAKKNAGHELTHHRGLAESLGALPKQPGGEKNADIAARKVASEFIDAAGPSALRHTRKLARPRLFLGKALHGLMKSATAMKAMTTRAQLMMST